MASRSGLSGAGLCSPGGLVPPRILALISLHQASAPEPFQNRPGAARCLSWGPGRAIRFSNASGAPLPMKGKEVTHDDATVLDEGGGRHARCCHTVRGAE